MIRSETEYQEAVKRLTDEETRLKAQRGELKKLDLSQAEIKRAMDPLQSFHEQLKEEVESYERLRRGEFEEVTNFEGMGRLLIALRISQGLSQRELAERLGVHESTVSRDERNEYHGITLERARHDDTGHRGCKQGRNRQREGMCRNIVDRRKATVVDLLATAGMIEPDDLDFDRIKKICDWRIIECKVPVFADTGAEDVDWVSA